MAETQVSSVRFRPSGPSSPILTGMRIPLSTLRRIIREAVVDHMRLPRGPNSRDDAEDRELDSPMKDRLNIEEDSTFPSGKV